MYDWRDFSKAEEGSLEFEEDRRRELHVEKYMADFSDFIQDALRQGIDLKFDDHFDFLKDSMETWIERRSKK